MKITAMSDLHSRFSLLKDFQREEVSGDILLCSGDLSNLGTKSEIENMLDLISPLQFKHKVIVFGNHDMFAENNLDYLREKYKDLIFLNNEIVEIEGIKIYGTPYVQDFCSWGFQYYTEEQRKELTIPKEEVDIIVAHEPPSHEKLSYTFHSLDIGNYALREYIENNDRVKYVICGHVHERKGEQVIMNKALVMNVSCIWNHFTYGEEHKAQHIFR